MADTDIWDVDPSLEDIGTRYETTRVTYSPYYEKMTPEKRKALDAKRLSRGSLTKFKLKKSVFVAERKVETEVTQWVRRAPDFKPPPPARVPLYYRRFYYKARRDFVDPRKYGVPQGIVEVLEAEQNAQHDKKQRSLKAIERYFSTKVPYSAKPVLPPRQFPASAWRTRYKFDPSATKAVVYAERYVPFSEKY